MNKVILFGSAGNVGKEIAKELIRQGYELTVVLKEEAGVEKYKDLPTKFVIADTSNEKTLSMVLQNQEIVISALSKTNQASEKNKLIKREVDTVSNLNILKESIKAKVKRFVYVTSFHTEFSLYADYHKAHENFTKVLQKSGIDYSIV
ncbi:MAG: NAD(P)H-binding protein [Chitinophagaceae bacterium]|nr:NAD(P)H-binding protein [Chitinophagaceae bacterium]MCU0384222.1 NAD(P)H-binding protein [Cyclobacteriaceae bacterium]